MVKSDTLYFDSAQANDLTFDYLNLPHKRRQYDVLMQIFSFAESQSLHLSREYPYMFITTLSLKKFFDVFSDLGIKPASFTVKRLGLFKKIITIIF